MSNFVRTALFAAPFLLLSTAPSFAQTVVKLSLTTARPTQAVTITGSGFAASEAVDLYLDTTDELLLVSSSAGALSASLTIPSTESPGKHYVTAVGRRSGDAAQAVLTVSTPWLEAGFGVARLANNPYENTLSTSNVASLGPSWSTSALGNGATPVVSNGSAYVANFTPGGVQRVSVATGAVIWSKLTTDSFYGGPALAGSTLYVGGESGTLYALAASTGATLRTTSLGSTIFSSPVVVGGVVYSATSNGVVYAVSATTGTVLWTYTTGGSIDSSPAVVNGAVYIGSDDDNVYALNAANGSLLWKYATGGQVESTPAVAAGILYVGSDDNNVYAIRAVASPINPTSAGTKIWSKPTGSAVFDTQAVANGMVYAGSLDGNLYALDGRTGTVEWSFATDSYPRSPIVANGVVYFTSNDGGLYALNALSGGKLLYGQSGGTYFGTPVVSDGVLYVNAYQVGLTAYAPLAGVNAVSQRAPAISSLHPDYGLQVTRR